MRNRLLGLFNAKIRSGQKLGHKLQPTAPVFCILMLGILFSC